MCYQTCDQHSSNCEGQGKYKVEELSQTAGVREDVRTEGKWDAGWTPQAENRAPVGQQQSPDKVCVFVSCVVPAFLETAMATHSSALAWKIPWSEEPGGLQSMGLQRVGRD